MDNDLDKKIDDGHNVNKPCPPSFKKQITEFVWTILGAAFIVVIVRCFLFSPFNIPSGSMIPSLLIGDYIFVSTYDYGYSKYSFPFSKPDFKGRIWYTSPKRGDVAVFRSTKPPYDYYVKRIIGLSGDTVQVKNGVLYVNNSAVPRKFENKYLYQENRNSDSLLANQYVESLPSQGKVVNHLILQDKDDYEYQETTFPDGNINVNYTVPYHVPEGYFFAMGDNRDHSADSRFIDPDSQDYLGYVPIDNLIGKVRFVFYSYDSKHPVWEFWYWPMEIRWNRLFKAVQ